MQIFTQNISFQQVSDKYISLLGNFDKESTVYSYISVIENHLLPYFRKKNINKLSTNDIITWQNSMNEKKYSIAYKRKVFSVLEAILDCGVSYFGLKVNVAKNVSNFKISQNEKEKISNIAKIKYITSADFKKLLSSVDEELWFVYFNLAYYTGMRKGEMQALTWEDIDFDQKKITVNKTLTVKTKNSPWKITSTKNLINRTIDIDQNLNNLLFKFLQTAKKRSDFKITDFILGDKEPLKQHKIDLHKSKYFKLAGIQEITNHEFRHSHVSALINEYIKQGGTDTRKFFLIMANRMGHTTEVMEKTYLHLFPDIQASVVKLINCINKENIL